MFSEGKEHAKVVVIGYGGVLPDVVVTPSVAVKVSPLLLVLREEVVLVGVSIEVSVGATIPAFFEGFPEGIHTVVPTGNIGVITKSIAVGIRPLERVVRESIQRVGYAVEVRIRATSTEFSLRFTVFEGANVSCITVGVVTVFVPVLIAPLRGICWERIAVVATPIIAVAVAIAVLPLARVVGEGVGVVTAGVIASVIAVPIGPLCRIIWEGVASVRIAIAISV